MQKHETDQAGNLVSLDAARERHKYIELANASEHWQQTRASFALEGIELTEDDAERAGRFIAGVVTIEQLRDELRWHIVPTLCSQG